MVPLKKNYWNNLQESINSIGGVNVFFPFFETSDYWSNQVICLRQDVSVDDYGEATDFAVSNFRNISGLFSDKLFQISSP